MRRRTVPRQQPPPATAGNPVIAVCGLLTLATLAVYFQTLQHGYVLYDDDRYFYENPLIRQGLSLQGIKWAFTTFYFSNWHPLTWLSYLLDYQLFGLNPAVEHAVNLSLHIGASILLFLALLRMTDRVWRSAIVAGIFALHPLHVESVAWIAERKDVLSAFFQMLTLWCYAGYAKRPEPRRYAGVLLAFALSLLAKPMAVSLPFVLVLLDFWPLRRTGRLILLEKLPLFALSAIASVLTWLAQSESGAVETIAHVSVGIRMANAVVGYARYIGKAFWPTDLAVLYPLEIPSAIAVAGSVLLITLVTALAIFQFRQRPYLLVGWLWFAGMLIPVAGLVQVGLQSIADRYTYVPLVGLSISVVWWIADCGLAKRVLAAIALCCLTAFGAAAYVQAGYWKNSESLFAHTIAVTTGNSTIENNLGAVLQHEARSDEAAVYFRQAIASDPSNAEAHYNLGIVLAGEGKRDEAIEEYRKALAILPDHAGARGNLGHELLAKGLPDQAFPQLSEAVRIKPEFPEAEADLGMLLAARNDFPEAQSHLETSLRLKPDNAEARQNLCFVFFRLNRFDDAIGACNAALTLRPDFLGTRVLLGKALAASGRTSDALAEFSRVLAIDPNHAGALAEKRALEKSSSR